MYDELPFVVPVWDRVPGEAYGRGPGHAALADGRKHGVVKATEYQWQLATAQAAPALEYLSASACAKPNENCGCQRSFDWISCESSPADESCKALVFSVHEFSCSP